MTERKTFAFSSVKSTAKGDDDPGGLEGYASTYSVDLQNDQVIAGAFTKDLPRFLKRGFIGFQHDWNAPPIAMPTKAFEDSRGLFLEATYHRTPTAQEVRTTTAERIAARKFVGLSIGFDVAPGGSKRRGDGVRELRELILHEVSIVFVPANVEAMVTGAKASSSADYATSRRDYQRHTERLARLRERVKAHATGERIWELRVRAEQIGFKTYLHVLPSHVDAAQRALAERTARDVALELGLAGPPRVKFISLAGMADHRFAREQGEEDLLQLYSGLRTKSLMYGVARAADNEIDINSDLRGALLVETVAHEVRHFANRSRYDSEHEQEADAEAYGRAYAARWAASGADKN